MKNWLELLGQQNELAALEKTNVVTKEYGLALSKEDALALVNARRDSLKQQRRVEFKEGIMSKLIYEFMDSAYMNQENYVETLQQLQDIFYLFKNEMQDEITDDELLHFMKEQFETICYGDLDYLAGTCLENFARAIHAGYEEHHNLDGYGVYQSLDEVERWDYRLYIEALNEQND